MVKKSSFFQDDSFPILARSQNIPRIDSVERAGEVLHEAIELKCFYEGSSTILIGDKLVEVTAGDIVVINPYELHATVHLGEVAGKYNIIMISPDFFRSDGGNDFDLRNLIFNKHMRFRTLFPQNKKMADIFQRIVDEMSHCEPYYKMAVRGLVYNLFSILAREGMYKDDTTHSDEQYSSYSVIEPALRCIRDNYSRKITMDELVAECFICKQYFCRVFKNVTGKTAMEYIKEYRILIADTLIVNTDMSIAQIAERCGFTSENYFVRCYKAHYGISPGNRRKDSKYNNKNIKERKTT